MTRPLLQVQNLTKDYLLGGRLSHRFGRRLRAVDDLSFNLPRGRTLALVGESGCGKSTVARCVTRLVEPTAGRVVFADRDVMGFEPHELRGYRRRVQLVFQDPRATLTPRMTAEALIAEPLLAHHIRGTRDGSMQRAHELLELVGLAPSLGSRYPHELSSGQCQRVVIARAIGLEPQLLILDEPVASLDKSIAAQILNLLMDLQETQPDITYMLISHDLSLVRHLADDVIVMYLGAAMETAPTETLFRHPAHPYTQALLSSIPVPDPILERKRQRIPLPGEVPTTVDLPLGCRFHPRCFRAEARCATDEPELESTGPGHHTACWYATPTPVL